MRLLRRSIQLRDRNSRLTAYSRRLRTELNDLCRSSRALSNGGNKDSGFREIGKAVDAIVDVFTDRGFTVIVLGPEEPAVEDSPDDSKLID